VKEFLSRNGHPFTTRYVDEDDEAYTALLTLGYRTVPVTVIAGHAVKGFDEPALRAAIAAASGS
jgi:glutaredoxin